MDPITITVVVLLTALFFGLIVSMDLYARSSDPQKVPSDKPGVKNEKLARDA